MAEVEKEEMVEHPGRGAWAFYMTRKRGGAPRADYDASECRKIK
jgi:hypothetical protein